MSAGSQQVEVRCLVCDGPRVTPTRIGPETLLRCADCALVFHTRFAADRAPERFRPEYFTDSRDGGYSDYLAESAALRRQAATFLALLSRHVPTRSLFDVGCAAGFLLDAARRDGWAARGCDASRWAVDVARRDGLDVECVPFDAAAAARLESARYGAVTFLNVIEHCADPRAAIARARRLLEPGGVLLIETWRHDSVMARLAGARWHQWEPRHVVAWFTRRSLQALVPASEWEWLRFGVQVRWLSLARGLEVLRLPAPRFARRLLLPYFLGDLVVLLARRR